MTTEQNSQTYTPGDYAITIEKSEENGGFVARCAAIPACSVRGNTPIEAYTNAQRSVADHLDQLDKIGMPHPDPSFVPSGPSTPETLEQDVEDTLADMVDLLVSHTEGPDSFTVSRHPDDDDPKLVWFVVKPIKGKASGILIGREGEMAATLRTIVRHFGYAHGRKFRLAIDTPPDKPTGLSSRRRRDPPRDPPRDAKPE